jgi:hypothetical protein
MPVVPWVQPVGKGGRAANDPLVPALTRAAQCPRQDSNPKPQDYRRKPDVAHHIQYSFRIKPDTSVLERANQTAPMASSVVKTYQSAQIGASRRNVN